MVEPLQLISSVECRRALWDGKNLVYKDRAHIAALWAEVAQECGASVKSVKCRWKTLKDAYRIASRKQEPSKWVWYNSLHFLSTQTFRVYSPKDAKYIKLDHGNSVHTDDEDVLAIDTVPANNELYLDKEETQSTGFKRKRCPEAHNSEENKADDDDLELFLRSLYKPISQLSQKRQMFLRMRFQELVFKEIETKDENE